MLVLGAGLQGAACAYDLLQQPGVTAVTLADSDFAKAPPVLDHCRKDPRLTLLTLDARDHAAVRKAMDGHAAVMCALPYYFNLDMTRLAIDAGAHFSDLGGNTEIVTRQKLLEGQARAKGVPTYGNISDAVLSKESEGRITSALKTGSLVDRRKAGLLGVSQEQVVATLASKARLTIQAGRLDHFKGWTGITAEVAENGDGKAIWTVTGIPVGYGPMWYVLIDRLAGKTEIRREALTSYDRPSDVARQFVQQFLPALGAEDGHGSAYTRNGGRSNWMLAEGFATLEPIMIHAGMIPATHRPKPARRKG